MTYDPDDRRNRPDILRKHDDSMNGAFAGGIAIALMLLFGVAIFALSSGNRDIAATDRPPAAERTAPSTTGQGGTLVAPSRDQNATNPRPPGGQPPGGAAK